MSDLMISVSGIRGIFGESLTPEFVLKTAAHFGVFCQRKKILLGRDSRTTGEALFNAALSGLLSVGCEVVNLGIVTTPTLLLAVEESDASGGICITASHNPAQWNALKFVDNNGMFLYPEKAEKFISGLSNDVVYSRWDRLGAVSEDYDASYRHVAKILKSPLISPEEIRKRKYKVVLDSVNGAGGVISPYLLRELGCTLIEINTQPTGLFAHDPEPVSKNLDQLVKAVKKHNADIGFATDPDVDRLAIVSEKGEAIGEEYSLLLAAKFILSLKTAPVVTNLSSTMALDDIAEEFQTKVLRTKVGEINVGKLMKETGSTIGGEGNGGIIWPEIHYTRDAVAGMALILALLTKSDKKISELVADIPRYYSCKKKIPVSEVSSAISFEKTVSLFPNTKTDRTDGLKILGDKFWVHLRKSGTEPIIRIYSEAETIKKAQEICDKVIRSIT